MLYRLKAATTTNYFPSITTAPTTTRSTFKSSQSIAKMKNCTFIVPDALLPSFESVAATKIFEEKEALALIGSASLS